MLRKLTVLGALVAFTAIGLAFVSQNSLAEIKQQLSPSQSSSVESATSDLDSTARPSGDGSRSLVKIDSEDRHKVFADMRAKAMSEGPVQVIVVLDIPEYKSVLDLDGPARAEQSERIKRGQFDVISRVTTGSVTMVQEFDLLPLLTVRADADGLVSLENNPDVLGIEEERISYPTLAESTAVINAPAAWAAGATGSGFDVAIIDTGVNNDHQFLAGRVVSEACYSAGEAGAASLCPGGVNSTAAESGENCTFNGSCDHGTHVAGIAAGNFGGAFGVARGANIVAIQVFSNYGGGSPLGASTTDINLGLQRVLALKTSTRPNLASANMSLGGDQFFANCDAAAAGTTAAITALRNAGVATVVASGNDGFRNSMAYPACISTAVSVGNTFDGGAGATPVDTLTNSSNHATFLSLLAPGNSIISSGGFTDTGMVAKTGTSMAAPHVAGAWAVLKSLAPANDAASVTTILAALQATGLPIQDSRAGFIGTYTKSRINLDAARLSLAAPPPGPFVYNASSNPGSDRYTLRLNGANYEIRDTSSSALLTSKAAALTTAIDINGENGDDDELTVHYAGGAIPVPVDFDGGTGAGIDSLVTTGYTGGTVTSNYTGPSSGSIAIGANGAITYANLEPVSLGGPAANLVFNLPAGANPDAILSDDGGAVDTVNGTNNGNTSAFHGSTFEYTEFVNPTNSLVVNGTAAGNDNVNVAQVDTAYAPAVSITLNLGAGATDTAAATGHVGTLNNLRFVPTGTGAGTVVDDNTLRPSILITGADQLQLFGQFADGDGVRLDGTGQNDIVALTPGATLDSGVFTGLMATNGAVFVMVPTTYFGIDVLANDSDVNFFNPGGTDSFIYTASTGVDDITVSGGEAGGLQILHTIGAATWSRAEVFNVSAVVVNAGDGADNIIVAPGTAAPATLTINGGTGADIFTATPIPNGAGRVINLNGGQPTPQVGDFVGFVTGGVANPVLTLNAAGDGTFASTSHQTINLTGFEPPTMTVTSLGNPSTYGQSVTFTASLSGNGGPIPTGTVSFFDGGTCLAPGPALGAAAAINLAGQASLATASLTAGAHNVIACYNPAGFFMPSSGSVAQAVNQAVLTVQASSHAVTYGDATPAVTPTYSGFVLGQGPGDLTTQPTCTMTYAAGSGVAGSPYSSSCSGGVSPNYTFVYANGKVHVEKAELTVDADDKTRAFGVANPTLTATITGFVLGQNLGTSGVTGSAGLSTPAIASSPVGTYPITATTGTLSSANYTFNFTPGTLTVTQAALTVTADNKSRVFGAPNPTLTYTITGFLNGESLATSGVTGTPSISTTAVASSGVGTYPITITAGTLASANYTFAFVNGTLTVGQAATTIVITNAAALQTATQLGVPYAVNFTVSPVAPSTGTPTGTVTVSDGAGQTCTASVAAGTCNMPAPTPGVMSITASYPGDANFTGSTTSQAVQHTVVIGVSGNIKQYIAFGTNTNLAGVTVTMTGSATGQTTTDANGNYSFGVQPVGGSYEITPSGLGKTYEASKRIYTNVTGNVSGGNFIAYDVPGPNANPRSARINNQIATAGQPVTIPVLMSTTGAETRVAFSVLTNSAVMGVPTVSCGSNVPGCTLQVDNNLPGKVGIIVTPVGGIGAGVREIVRITYPTQATTLASTPIQFGDFPTARDVRNADNNPIPTLYWTDGLLQFTGNTVIGGPSISGRVTTAGGQGLRNATVVLTDTTGGRQTAVTSSFGAYSFENLEAGRTYSISVLSKRYRFATRVVNLTDSVTGMDFVGLE